MAHQKDIDKAEKKKSKKKNPKLDTKVVIFYSEKRKSKPKEQEIQNTGGDKGTRAFIRKRSFS